MHITANITGIRYTPFLCRSLNMFEFDEIENALAREASFLLKIDDKSKIAVSWWVSAKRTRSYPYVRVYDTLGFSGKKATIIPIVKDEGKDGDRDFLQWDTISLMSLLGIYVIVAYYKDASVNPNYDNKITNQRFDIEFIKSQIMRLLSYQSDALHWNLSQIDEVGKIGQKALESYARISQKLGVEMHSKLSAEKRIRQLQKGKETFMGLSRNLAMKAQKRESITAQPKEKLKGVKATLTIKNYLGGCYFLTSDEVELSKQNLHLIEGKHTRTNNLPSVGDIKDGFLKMILFANLKDVEIDGRNYDSVAVLKLTTGKGFSLHTLSKSKQELLDLLEKEAKANNFRILINDKFLV